MDVIAEESPKIDESGGNESKQPVLKIIIYEFTMKKINDVPKIN